MRATLLSGLITLTASPLLPGTAGGQIATDRPDFVESSTTVPAGSVQVEASVAFTRESDELDVWTTPTLLRFGLSDALEARVESDWLVRLDSGSGRGETGVGEIAVGLKWHLHGGGPAAGPSFGLLVHADLPSPSGRPFGSGGVRPSLRAVGEWELPAALSFGMMPGVIHERTDDGERFVAAIFGMVVGKAWSPRFRTFVEAAWERIAPSDRGGSVGFWDFGATVLLRPTLQLDGAVSIGIGEEASDLGLTIGLSALTGG